MAVFVIVMQIKLVVVVVVVNAKTIHSINKHYIYTCNATEKNQHSTFRLRNKTTTTTNNKQSGQ